MRTPLKPVLDDMGVEADLVEEAGEGVPEVAVSGPVAVEGVVVPLCSMPSLINEAWTAASCAEGLLQGP